MLEEQERQERVAKRQQGPKLKKGRGRNAKKKKKAAKEGDGYEVW